MTLTNYETISLALSIIVIKLKQRNTEGEFFCPSPASNENAPWTGAEVTDSLVFNVFISAA
jgi:hypothetical protein